MDDKPVITDLSPDFSFTRTGGGDYLPAPVKKLLKAHVQDVKSTQQIDNFKTLPSGEENPNFGKAKTVYIFSFVLDESEAKGQSYTAWVSDSVSERSNLGKIADALLGSWSELIATNADGSPKFRLRDLIGLPLQLALKPGIKNPDRLNVNVDKLMPPADDQKRVEVIHDTVVTDLSEDADPIMEAAHAVFGS